MKPIYKGQFEYIKKKKKQRAIITAVCFLLVLAVFFLGYFSTGKRENLLTVAAILGVLPAAKFAVSFLMFLPHHSQTAESYAKVQSVCGEAALLTDMLISTEKKVLPTDFMVVRCGNVIGYASQNSYDAAFAQKYITDMLKRNGIRANVKIFTDESKFLKRVSELAAMEPDEKQDVRDGRTEELLLTLIL